MNQCEDREEGVPPSKSTLCGEHDTRTKAQSPEQQNTPDSAGLEPGPEPSCVSIKSDWSMDTPMKFNDGLYSANQWIQCLVPTCVSIKSDRSMDQPFFFKDKENLAKRYTCFEQRVHQDNSNVPSGQFAQQHQTDLESIFTLLEDNIVRFVKNELKRFQRVLSPVGPESLESQREDEEVLYGEEEEQRRSSKESFLKITLHFLRRMKQEELADCLQSIACELTLDSDTAYRKLRLSDDNKNVTTVREYQPYPDHPERFDCFCQLLCRNGLTGRCYWEVEWEGAVHIAVTYRGIRRKGNSADCRFGINNQSWTLSCSGGGYSVWHNDRVTDLPRRSSSSSSSSSGRVAVYVDCPAGTLSFYRVSSDTLIHLHTFNTTFTEPLYPGFGIGIGFGIRSSGSVSLCEL
ncbi:tripartite motif-containing protein 16-like [Dicentrarchus labrax]|uniref:tripartite motif-containing protein 16-like n=1 Tax=Dicentrarchus labrax TaxID=13489 RepID=UPI0021F5063C|nr:tripartite motif-containing protein 16-like [Dicentrarchus labrax]